MISYKTGFINKPPGKTCRQARRIHLSFLQNDFKNYEKLVRFQK